MHHISDFESWGRSPWLARNNPPGPSRILIIGLIKPDNTQGTGIASDLVRVQGEDPAIPGCLRKDSVGSYVGDSQWWVRSPLARASKRWDRNDSQWFKKTEQHTHGQFSTISTAEMSKKFQ